MTVQEAQAVASLSGQVVKTTEIEIKYSLAAAQLESLEAGTPGRLLLTSRVDDATEADAEPNDE